MFNARSVTFYILHMSSDKKQNGRLEQECAPTRSLIAPFEKK